MLDEVVSTDVFEAVTGMFADPRNRWFTLYILTSMGIAWLVYRHDSRHDEHVREEGFFRYLFPRDVWSHESARADYWFFAINKLLFVFFFGALVLSSTVTSNAVMSGLTALFGEATPVSSVALATLVTTVLAILAADFGLWLGHWLLHRIPVLWEFHKVHHSAEVLTPFTAGRVHPLEDLINMWLSGLCGGFVFGLCQYAFGPSATMITVFQLNVIMFLFYVFGFHLRHSHVWVAYKGVWGKLFVSPAHHQLHHSIATRHWDKNMGFVFAIWDWAFGTLFVPERREKIVFGMNGWEEKEFHSVKAMYLLPFVKAWRLIRGRADAPAQQSTLPSE